MSAISIDCSKKIGENTKHIISIYEKHSKTISKLESTIQRRVNSIETHTPAQVNNIPKWTDIEKLEKRCDIQISNISSSIEYLKQQHLLHLQQQQDQQLQQQKQQQEQQQKQQPQR